MSVLEAITAKAAQLPLNLQQEALKQIELLAQRFEQIEEEHHDGEKTPEAQNGSSKAQPQQMQSNFGSLAHLMNVTEKDIAEVRREMWRNFPREEPR